MASDQFSLCWDNFHKNMSTGMHSLLENEDLVDVTLAIEGQYLKAHKMVLSVCSPYFRTLFAMNPCKHPIVFMKDVSYLVMNDLLTFMYQGEVQVNQENLATFIKTAEALQIKGLTGDSTEIDETVEESKPNKRSLSVSEEPKMKTVKKVAGPTPKKQKIGPPVPTLAPISMPPKLTQIPAHKTEITTPNIDQNVVQFKMEPYESTEQPNNDTFDDNQVEDSFADDTMDETTHEEDYSLMEGDDEPQAGTSADGVGDSQDEIIVFEKPDPTIKSKRMIRKRFIHDGFVYHTKVLVNNIRYLGCAEIKKSGCRARAILPVDDFVQAIRVTKDHNHPPDLNAEEKYDFINHLKEASKSLEPVSLKNIYDTIKIQYYSCQNKKISGCRTTARLDKGASTDKLIIKNSHNHPPDAAIDTKHEFELQIKEMLKTLDYPIKTIYDIAAEGNPGASLLIPYTEVMYRKMKRWRLELRTYPRLIHCYGRNRKRQPIVKDGFFYCRVKNMAHNGRCYYKCLNYKRLGCVVTSVLPYGGDAQDLIVRGHHNHPPDPTTEIKQYYMIQLHAAVQAMPGIPHAKLIYDNFIMGNPEGSKIIPFTASLASRMKRWKQGASLGTI